MTRDLIAVRQLVNNLDSSVEVQELELAMNLALNGLLWSLGNQYIMKSMSWRSLTFTGSPRIYFVAKDCIKSYQSIRFDNVRETITRRTLITTQWHITGIK